MIYNVDMVEVCVHADVCLASLHLIQLCTLSMLCLEVIRIAATAITSQVD